MHQKKKEAKIKNTPKWKEMKAIIFLRFLQEQSIMYQNCDDPKKRT